MKDFFKFMFASMLGFFLVILLISFLSFGIIAGIIAATTSTSVSVPSNSVLRIRLDKPVFDRTPKLPFLVNLQIPGKTLGLDEILKNIHKAKTDDKIKGILLDISVIPAGIETLREIRNALSDFRRSGKFIIAYSEVYSQSSYYLASVADRVYLYPEGTLIFKGINAEMTFLKGLLDKIDVKVQVVRHGKFKAATEPLFLDKMSPENRLQITTLINSIWNNVVDSISASRRIPVAELNRMADSLSSFSNTTAIQRHLVDGLLYSDQLTDTLKKVLHIAGDREVSYISIEKYSNAPDPSDKKPGRRYKIAVIFASGSIGSGEGDDRNIGSERISKALREAREDDRVKAVVFRINSPGGSALASDVIWREVKLTAKEKPVVASFGDVAASGGYYIGCASTRILADPVTLTGSIGVFGVVPNFKGLFNNKLGITFDRAGTNANSDYVPVTEPLSAYQTAVLQRDIETIYDSFITRVAEGRKMTKEKVDSIGQGRIWSGSDALKIGLIDEFGGMEDAVKAAAKLAGISDYSLLSLPRQKDPLQQFIEEFTDDTHASLLEKELGDNYKYWQYLQEVSRMQGVQARLPFEITIQ